MTRGTRLGWVGVGLDSPRRTITCRSAQLRPSIRIATRSRVRAGICDLAWMCGYACALERGGLDKQRVDLFWGEMELRAERVDPHGIAMPNSRVFPAVLHVSVGRGIDRRFDRFVKARRTQSAPRLQRRDLLGHGRCRTDRTPAAQPVPPLAVAAWRKDRSQSARSLCPRDQRSQSRGLGMLPRWLCVGPGDPWAHIR